MWSAGVVVVAECIELGLQFGDVGGSWSCLEPLFEGLVEAFDFPLGLGMVGFAVLLLDAEVEQFDFEAVGSVSVSCGEHHSVVCQRRLGCSVLFACGTEGGQHDASGDGFVGGGRQEVAGVVVEPK